MSTKRKSRDLTYQESIAVERICQLIRERTGLIPNEHQCHDLAGTLHHIAAVDDSFFNNLHTIPLVHPIWQRIIHTVTIGETYFFRNQSQFDALRHHILPTLIQKRRQMGNQFLRIWSAGSATGEEPYSIAMLLRELLPDIASWGITLLATDINEGYLDYARRGLYRQRSFRSETPAHLQEKWFTSEPDGYRLLPTVTSMVHFKLLNLVSDDYPSLVNNTMYMDIIFCRNVTIYFDRETTKRVVNRFRQALNPDGWLVVGHSEPQADLYYGYSTRNFTNTVIYQKAENETQAAMPVFNPPKPAVFVQPPARVETPKPVSLPLPPAPEPAPPAPSIDDYWEKAKASADSNNVEEARQWLDKADQIDRFQPQVHYLRALLELQEGDIEASLQLLRKSIYCDVDFVLAHYMLGDLLQRQGMHKEAARQWQRAINTLDRLEADQILPYSDNLTAEILAELLATRLAEM